MCVKWHQFSCILGFARSESVRGGTPSLLPSIEISSEAGINRVNNPNDITRLTFNSKQVIHYNSYHEMWLWLLSLMKVVEHYDDQMSGTLGCSKCGDHWIPHVYPCYRNVHITTEMYNCQAFGAFVLELMYLSSIYYI